MLDRTDKQKQKFHAFVLLEKEAWNFCINEGSFSRVFSYTFLAARSATFPPSTYRNNRQYAHQ